MQLEILYEDNHLLVINKPALLATMGAASGKESLVNLAKRYLKDKYDKPGNVYLGVVSRLDSHVTGAVIFARTSKSAARISRQFQQHVVKKTYWAIVPGDTLPKRGTWTDYFRKNDARRRMEVCQPDDPAAIEAITRFRLRRTLKHLQWVELEPITGRKHQLRVQLSSRGHAILGDRKYDSQQRFDPGIALHARALRIEHPVRHEAIKFVAPLPQSWQRFAGLVDIR